MLLEGGTDAPDMPEGVEVGMEGSDGTSGARVATSTGSASHDGGVYVCALGGLPLFLPEHGLPLIDASRRGWPGFWRPVHPEHVVRIAFHLAAVMTKRQLSDTNASHSSVVVSRF